MAIRNDFTAGEVLAAADLNDTFASKVDYALPVNAQTGTTYTFVAADAEKLTTASNAAAVTLTIPPQSSVTWSDNTVLRVVNYGAGAVTIDGGSGVTVTNTSSTIAQYGAAVAIRTGSDAWTVVPFGGGDIPAATVSSPAATGQYTDTGITYDYYTFTSSGTLTVDTAGFADVLVVGGGGAGGYGQGVGGGAGGGSARQYSNTYLPAGSLTVTIGAGGAGATTQFANGKNGGTSFLGSLISMGGGGGGSTNSSGSGVPWAGSDGGSGGGAGEQGGVFGKGGGTGLDGGNGGNSAATNAGGAGGGAGANAADSTSGVGANGGAGISNSYTGSSVTYGGGAGGNAFGGTAGNGGAGGGANGRTTVGVGASGSANTGGGGAGGLGGNGGNGGSGVVIVRVKV